MRRIDAWVGIPFCALLTVWRRVVAPLVPSSNRARKGILFVKLAEQGSTVLAYAALHRAVEKVGRENVYFLTFDQNRFIVDAMEVIPPENVVTIRTGSLLAAAFSPLRAAFRMRKLALDAAIDLEFFARSSAILTYLSGAQRRVGLHAFGANRGPWRGNLMSHPVRYDPQLHTAQLFRGQVEALDKVEARDQGARPLTAGTLASRPIADLPRARFRPTEEERRQARAIVCKETGQNEPPSLVLLNANCSDLLPLRKWHEDNYVELARRLLARDKWLHVAFTGAPEEAAHVVGLVEAIDAPRCHSLAGRTTLPQLLAIYGLAEVLVTNDSGPAHFATLTSIDVVALFGPETPRLFGGLSENTHVIWAATACSPCVNAYNNRLSHCQDNVCMQQISVETVYRKVTDILERRAAGRGRVPSLLEPPRGRDHGFAGI